MLSTLSGSGVFSSRVDYFCLVCESRLRDEADAAAHVAKPVHTKNFLTTEYFENQQECVRKIKKWYLCELCNVLLPTAARVRLHVVEAGHWERRAALAVQRRAGKVLVFANVQLDDRAWNGIVDDTCAICNIEFDDEHIHRNETTHILKLIQSKIEYDENQNIYRWVDESSFQCLTCNMVLALNSINEHFDEIEHKDIYRRCCDNFKITENTATNETIDSSKNNNKRKKEVPTKITDRTETLAVLNTTNKNKTNIESNEKAEIKTSTVNSDSKTIQNNTKENFKEVETVKSAPIDDSEICDILNAKEYITRDENGKNWCILCNWVMSPLAIKQHINDLHHQTMLKMHKKRLSTLNTEKNITTNTPIVKNNTIKNKENIDKESVLNAVDKFQKNNININFEIETAVCKKCSKQLDFNAQSIENHIKEHGKIKNKNDDRKEIPLGLDITKDLPSNKETSLYTTPVKINKEKQEKIKDMTDSKIKKESSFTSDLNELQTYAKQNNMTYKDNEKKIHCNKCNIDLTLSMKILKEHVSLEHKKKNEEPSHGNLTSKSKQIDKEINLIKIPTRSFIVSAVAIDSLHKEIIINDKFCINLFSFCLMFSQNKRLTCIACDCSVPFQDFHKHLDTEKHEQILDKSLVVVQLENEFIREYKPGCYQCGYCNTVCESWSTTESHIQTTDHKNSRIAAQWRLQQLLPEVAKKRQQNQLHEKFMMHMMFADGGWNSCDSD
ncbi:PREDICTED: uncharacterized protein LOC106116417 [Papilio xuthus]|uniref:Uncharacterized protein LOC106116417 n=1 Tax=Papilio xuthus TaxID=66420 RepID=A0AAJ6Z5D6_PAPXU|nr:PREDICTED: uncharacterized protein LOC106116417 [Papilio xuthus]